MKAEGKFRKEGKRKQTGEALRNESPNKQGKKRTRKIAIRRKRKTHRRIEEKWKNNKNRNKKNRERNVERVHS